MFSSLMLSMLGKIFSKQHFDFFLFLFYFLPENRHRYFMQIVSLHEVSKSIFREK